MRLAGKSATNWRTREQEANKLEANKLHVQSALQSGFVNLH